MTTIVETDRNHRCLVFFLPRQDEEDTELSLHEPPPSPKSQQDINAVFDQTINHRSIMCDEQALQEIAQVVDAADTAYVVADQAVEETTAMQLLVAMQEQNKSKTMTADGQ